MEIKNIQFSPPDISEAEWIGTEKCVYLNSQTSCAEMAFHVMGIGPGDEVITV